MKQNITLAIDKGLLKRVRAYAGARGVSVSGMLSEELVRIVERGLVYEQAKRKALAHLDAPLHLGGKIATERRYMRGKIFVDSNILIYAHDSDAGVRQQQAAEWLKKLWHDYSGCLSTQVLQEFYVNVTQKIRVPIAKSSAREIVRDYGSWVHSEITPATVIRASEISEVWKISFWDGMIIAAAEQEEAEALLSEDLNHGQLIAGIRIVNPFETTGRDLAN